MARSGDHTGAVASWRERLRLATVTGVRPEVAHCHLGLGRFHRLVGDDAGARHLEIELTMFEEMGMRFWGTQAEAALHS